MNHDKTTHKFCTAKTLSFLSLAFHIVRHSKAYMQSICLQSSQSVRPHICCNTIWCEMADPLSAFCFWNHLCFHEAKCLPTMLFLICASDQGPTRFFSFKAMARLPQTMLPCHPSLEHCCIRAPWLLAFSLLARMCPQPQTHFLWEIQTEINLTIDSDSMYISWGGSVMCVPGNWLQWMWR